MKSKELVSASPKDRFHGERSCNGLAVAYKHRNLTTCLIFKTSAQPRLEHFRTEIKLFQRGKSWQKSSGALHVLAVRVAESFDQLCFFRVCSLDDDRQHQKR